MTGKKIFTMCISFLMVLMFAGGAAWAEFDKFDMDQLSEVPGAKKLYVIQTTNPMYYDATRYLKPYADGTRKLFTTIADAYAATTSGQGDEIIIMPGFSDVTLTAGVTISNNNVTIRGVGDKPVIGLAATAGTTDTWVFNITGDGVRIENLFIDAPLVDNVAGAIRINDCSRAIVKDIDIKSASLTGNFSFADTIILDGAQEAVIDGIKISSMNGSTYCPATFVDLQDAITNTTIMNCQMFGDVGTAGIIDDVPAYNLALIGNIVAVTGTTKEAVTLDGTGEAVTTGIAVGNYWAGTNTGDLASAAALGNGMRKFDNHVLSEIDGTVQGTPISPARDAD